MNKIRWVHEFLLKKGESELLEYKQLHEHEHCAFIPPTLVPDFIIELNTKAPIWHLTTITGQDTGEALEVLYHFWLGYGLTIRTSVTYDNPIIPSISPLIAGAGFYEREISEMLGVNFLNQKESGPLFLPDGWDEGWPLRKDKGKSNDET